ncbi:amidohydrolase [Sesbania bispinosa]|nr:amidohydrolase [Sesbania bispinosa]
MVTAQDRGCGVWMGDGKKSGAVGRAVVVSARKGKPPSVTALQCIYDTATEAVTVGVMVGHR